MRLQRFLANRRPILLLNRLIRSPAGLCWESLFLRSSSSSSTHRPVVLIQPAVDKFHRNSQPVGSDATFEDEEKENDDDDRHSNSAATLVLGGQQDGLVLPQLIYDARIHLPSAPQSWEGYEPSTPLTEEIIALVGVTGRPISVSDYMRMALTHPSYGYYTQATGGSNNNNSSHNDDDDDDFDHDDFTNTGESSSGQTIIGPRGDFVTAPEISQVFGECIGIWFYAIWERQQLQKQLQSGPGPLPSSQDGDDIGGISANAAATAVAAASDDTARNGWQWLECGPGRGSLMADLILFTTTFNNDFTHTCRAIHWIETSPALKLVQRNTLIQECSAKATFRFHDDTGQQPRDDVSGQVELAPDQPGRKETTTTSSSSKPTIDVYWHESIAAFGHWQASSTAARLPTFCVCQEFLDALPVYSFEKTSDGWRERLVDVALREDLFPYPTNATHDPTETTKTPAAHGLKPRLRVVLAPEVTPPLRTLLSSNEQGQLRDQQTDAAAPVGSVIEVCPEGMLLVQDLASIIQQQGGAALVIDYGREGSTDSIRGFARHRQVHFLSRPGQVDVTADVDFAALRHAVNSRLPMPGVDHTVSVSAFGPVTQGNFLMSMGIQDRVIQFIERDDISDAQAEALYGAMVRLASSEEMGERYKVMAFAQPQHDGSPPPGF